MGHFGRIGLGVLSLLQTSLFALDLPYTTSHLSVYPQTATPYEMLIVRGDITNDGRDDLVVGGTNHFNTQLKTPVKILRNLGNNTLGDLGTSLLVGAPGPIQFYQPTALVADFNGDGLNDLVFFDKGRQDRAIGGGYMGEAPMAFYSTQTGTLQYANQINTAIKDYRAAYNSPHTCGGSPKYYSTPNCDIWVPGDEKLDTYSNDAIHSKFQAAADIDGDGDIDIFAEGGGGFMAQAYGLFFINDGTGNFTVEYNYSRIAYNVLHGPVSWRHGANHFADVNGDGVADLILGKMGNIQSTFNTDHDTLFSKVLINDGSGNFPTQDVIELTNPADFETGPMEQATVVTAITAQDLNQDGLMDLVLVHTRGTDADNLSNTPWTETGRFLQLQIQTAPGVFKDLTADWIADQSPYTVIDTQPGFSHDPAYASFFLTNRNAAFGIQYADVNADGQKDLLMEKVNGNLHSDYSPTAYLKGSDGKFHAHNSTVLQATNNYYYSGRGLTFLNLDLDAAFEMVMTGPYYGGVSAPIYGTYLFLPQF